MKTVKDFVPDGTDEGSTARQRKLVPVGNRVVDFPVCKVHLTPANLREFL